jgi:hypothetical protein
MIEFFKAHIQFVLVTKFLFFSRCRRCRLRVFENRVLRRIFGPKKDEVTGE